MYSENKFIPYEAVNNIGNGNVLVLAPHPDDEVFGCAGTIMKHVESKDPVQVIIVSDGGYLESEKSGSREEYIRMRKEESIQAGTMLGYVPEFWDIPDREVAYGEKLIAQISNTIEALDIDLVYAPSVLEIHPDHRSLGMAVTEAVRRSNRNISVAFYEIGIPLRPNRLLDISALLARKQEAMACFRSQLQQQKYDQHIAALNRFRTYTLPTRIQAAEAYFIINSEQLKADPLALYHQEEEKITFPGLDFDAGRDALVTVIIRSIGRKKFLSEALASVALQTYPLIEVLVVNAKGEGHPVLDPWCGRFPLRICETGEPLSRSRAANLGLKNANGKHLIFLDDDDLFDPDHVAQLMTAIDDKKNYLAAYAGVRVSTEGKTSCNSDKVYNDPFDAVRLLCHNYIPMHAVIFSHEVVDKGCLFDEKLSICEDWDFWIQVAKKTDFIHVDHISATYRISDSGSSIWQDEKIAREATMKIFKKWAPLWSEEQLFTIAYQSGEVHNYEVQAQQLVSRIQEQSTRISELNTAVEAIANEKNDFILERDALTAQRDALTAQRDDLAAQRDDLAAQRDDLAAQRDDLTAERDSLSVELQHHRGELQKIFASKSWRLTAILRGARRVFTTRFVPILRKLASDGTRLLWSLAPVTIERKQAMKKVLFKNFPLVFKHTLAYQNWLGTTSRRASSPRNVAAPEISLKHILENTRKKYVPLLEEAPYNSGNIRLIAFYLPQFHPIPENDEWWGEGFTEWTNVKAAKPQFAGHYQPHIPGELGYYDLGADAKIHSRQIELARLYGLEGFCFYFYWFDGKRLLEDPVLQYLENKELDFPFCLCWANENWSRCWDGLDNKILISQNHTPDDDLAFIEYVTQYLRDRRYIRIGGKPLLIVYRPNLLPSAKKTAERWRQWCRDHGVGEIYLAYTQSFEAVNPKEYGFDAAIEFPPNRAGIQPLTHDKELFQQDFTGVLYDLSKIAKRSHHYSKPDYALFRGVCPAWDNTPRRKEKATIFVNNSPTVYREWLYNAALDTAVRFEQKDERLLFVNAWNEWAEGAYLEPDQANGYAYLQATKDALVQADSYLGHRRILLVAHDAHPHGAQSLILNLAKVLHEDFSFTVDMIVLGGGILLEKYARYATIHSLEGKKPDGREAIDLAADLFARGIHTAICNTTVTGIFVKALKEQGFQVVSLIHELPGVIKNNNLQPCVESIIHYADCVVFPARQVQQGFESFSEKPLPTAVIRPQGLFRKNTLYSLPIGEAKKRLREKLNLGKDEKIVLSIAFGDHRKGIDLFVEAGLRVVREMENVSFVWVGHFDATMEGKVKKRLESSGFADHFIFPGMDFQPDLYYAGADLYALTSREDPFPNVVLEALNVATPVIAFDGAGGFTELLSRGTGTLVAPFDTKAYAKEIINLLQHPDILQAQGNRGKEIVAREFSFRRYLFDLLDLAASPVKRVSVIVPNYNYARYLSERINSIVQQTYPLYEIIILDDASTDDSIELLEKLLPDLDIDFTFMPGKSNSGNPFTQWMKGIELAGGNYIWIAEADDLASPGFLEEVMKPFSDPRVVMSYCQSKQITSSGDIVSNDYLDYVADILPEKWLGYYMVAGTEEARAALAIKNTIPNVSAVVFDKKRLLQVLRENLTEITTYQVAGDWLTYLLVLREGKIAFSPEPFNSHRRHQESITLGSFNISQLREIVSVQKRARELFYPEDVIIEKAHAYSQQLYENFGLANNAAPLISNNSELNDFLKDPK